MSKLGQTFQSTYKPSQASMLFHTTYLPLSEFCNLCENLRKHHFFLNPLMEKIIFGKDHWFYLFSTKSGWIISLFLISIILHSLSLGHSIMSSFCWQKNNLWLSMKTLLLLLTKSPNARKLFLGLLSVFISFSFFDLLRTLLQICKVWLTQS